MQTDINLMQTSLPATAMLTGLIDSIPDLIFFKDRDGVYLGCNAEFARLVGHPREQIVGHCDHQLFPSAVADAFRENDRMALAQEHPRHNDEWITYPDGTRLLVDTYKSLLKDSSGEVIGLVGVARDITERHAEQRVSHEREAYLRAILNNVPLLMWLKDRDGRFLAVNQVFAESCGRENPEAVVGKTDLDVWPRELAEAYRKDDEGVMRARESVVVEEPVQDHGEVKWFETCKTPILDGRGEVMGTTGVARDITERKRAEVALHDANIRLREQMAKIQSLQTALREESIRDPLTGLHNRRYLEEMLALEISRAERAGYPVSVVMMDVDRFKGLNDTHGHAAGDEVLRCVGAHLHSMTRAGDIVCRYGGDEIVVALHGESTETARERAEEWRAAIENLWISFGGHTLQITMSVGVAAYPEDGDSVDEVILAADAAMYRAKTAGRNLVLA